VGKKDAKKRVLYLCDPEKNTECRKSNCKHNTDSDWRVCECTSRKECSVDGIEVEVVMEN